MAFTTVSEKNYVEKRCSRCFWQKMKSWWGKYTDQNISARSFTLLIFAVGWGIVWSTTTRTRVSDATAVTFSVKCFNPMKTLSSVRKHLQKVVCFILFIYSRAFNNHVISNGKSYCCNNTGRQSGLHSYKQRMFKKNINYFYAIESVFHWLFCLQFSFKLGTFSKSYARKQ